MTKCTEFCSILFMIKTLPITEARQKLPLLIERASKMLDEYVVTVNGKPAAVIMSVREYEGLRETNEILADKKSMRSIRQGEKEIAEGKGRNWEEVKKELNWD